MEIEIEFECFPNFLENERASGMEIGIFEVVSKIIVVKLFSRNGVFRGMHGKVLNGL